MARRLRDKQARGEPITIKNFVIDTINYGNRTEWSPIRCVIIEVINKSDDREAGVRFVNHEYD